jgi:hypothetical protein
MSCARLHTGDEVNSSLVLAALCCDTGASSDRLRSLYLASDDDSLWSFSSRNRVEPLVAHTLMNVFGPDNIPSRWRRAHDESLSRISAYMAELDRVAVQLAEAGIQLAALKNGGIARGIYPCPGCCPMGDLDVLVEKRHFQQAHEILLGMGYHFEFRSPLEEADLEKAEKSGGTEYWKTLPNGKKMWLELQWRSVAGRWIQPDQEPATEDLMARSVSIPGTAVRLLSPEDNLLQAALHTAKHSYVRAPGLRLHLDVERIVRYQAIDWALFLSRTLALQVKTPVFFSLAMPKALFGTPVPDDVLDAVRPPAWKERLLARWIQRAGLYDPDERKFSRLEYISFTALLYDDLGGLCRGIFPSRAWIRQRYGFRGVLLLPVYYVRRLTDLLWRRVST